MFPNFGGEREHVLQRRATFERPLAGALDNRTIGERIAEGDTQLNHTRPRIDSSQYDLARGSKVGVAAGYVGDERWLVFEMKGHTKINRKNYLINSRLYSLARRLFAIVISKESSWPSHEQCVDQWDRIKVWVCPSGQIVTLLY